MIQRLLVANRGEIAVRIIRTCKKLGIESVAVYSEADADALHVHLADQAVCIGKAPASKSYLNQENIISAAIGTNCEAIHPGFGFLSEDASFAALVESCGLTFIGPRSSVIESMGDKSRAKQLMKEANVPLVPGSSGEVSLEEGKQLAEDIGYPILIKASAGGGGRGMRIVKRRDQFEQRFDAAKQEAKAAFSSDGVYIEKFVENPRHIEVQVLGDKYGNAVHIGTRDCSIQRRNQKVLEEAPANIDASLEAQMYEASLNAVKAVGYENAGTIEYIVSDDAFYFIEMNTRIQVEHPVSEMISGIDLIEEQLRIASGEAIRHTQEDITFSGHAIELRINAEDPKQDFRPAPGTIGLLHIPQGLGIRFDSPVYPGYQVPPHYDSMIGKLIAHGYSRDDAIAKLRAALEELIVSGVTTNQFFHMMILMDPSFIKGSVSTAYIENQLEALLDYET